MAKTITKPKERVKTKPLIRKEELSKTKPPRPTKTSKQEYHKLNSGQKKILIVIVLYTLLWTFQYYLEYLPGLFDFIIIITQLSIVVALVIIGLTQVIIL